MNDRRSTIRNFPLQPCNFVTLKLPREHVGTWALRHTLFFLAFLSLFACSRNPLAPATGVFVFQETWGKDYYSTSKDIGPGHGDGTSGSEIGAFNMPTALDVHSDEIFVLDAGNHRVQKFSLDGAPRSFDDQSAAGVTLNCLGSEGIDTNEFVDPSDLCVSSSGDIFVADRGNFCVQVFAASGTNERVLAFFRHGFPALTNGPGGFIKPEAVTIGPDRCLFVLDTAKSTIDKFSNTLNVNPAWGTSGSLHDDDFAYATDIEWYKGSLYALCRTRILKFDKSGDLIGEMALAGFGTDQLADAIRLTVSDSMFIISDGNYVKFFNLDGGFLFSIGGLSGDRVGEFNVPAGTALVGDDLYVADSGNNRIQLFRR